MTTKKQAVNLGIGYSIQKVSFDEEWGEVDSCWGCYEETDELIKEVMIENGLEE